MSADIAAVRSEDLFDVARLGTWLAEQDSSYSGEPTVKQFTGGASNLTYLVSYPHTQVIVRRPPHGSRRGAGDGIVREYRVQTALRPVFPCVPATVALCEDTAVIGGPFYVMEYVDGLIPRRDLPSGIPNDRASVASLCERTLGLLTALHDVDVGDAGVDWMYKGEGYVARQVEGWSRRWAAAVTPDAPELATVMTWLDGHQPPDRGIAFIHNDFRLDNIVFSPTEPTRPRALLDWEMATVGDPFMDLGVTAAYWVQADDDPGFVDLRRQPTHLPGMYTRRELVQRYCEATGRGFDDAEWRFYEIYGWFRLAVICQQIYYRFYHGHTTNPAFAPLATAVQYLASRCIARTDR